MLLKRIIPSLQLISLFLFFSSTAYCAEVFYLGAGVTDTSSLASNPNYSLAERVKDLFDFTSARDYKDRSGRISGTFLQEVEWDNVGDNRSKSFLRNGTNYLTELNINLQEKLLGDYNFEGQWFLRKTDNQRIEVRDDVRMKNMNLKIANPNNLFEFGDFYGDLSQFVLCTSLEGLNANVSVGRSQKYKLIVAREYKADETTNKFQRNVFAFKSDYWLFNESSVFSNFRLGLQSAAIIDDASTISRTSDTKELRNYVMGVDGEVALKRYFSFVYEVAHSFYLEDKAASPKLSNSQANAVRFQPAFTSGNLSIRYLCNWAQPKFYTDTGSAQADKIQHQISADYRFNNKASVSLTENYYWDHLSGSSLTKRTTNDEKYLTFNLRPFDKRKDFTFRPYFNYLQRNSDDVINSAESATWTGGFNLNDSLDEDTTAGFNYEYRAYIDEANDVTSEYFHRLTVNIGRQQQLFLRRLYFSAEPGVTLRNAKGNYGKKDTNITFSLNGQYDLLSKIISRFGYNMQDAILGKPDSDYVNHRTFLEFDYLLSKKKGAHLVIRGERNLYHNKNADLDYTETRAICKFMSNF